MPKTRKQKPRGSIMKKTEPLRFKFKLGGRKSQTSALAMSTKALVEKFDTAPGKDKAKIMKVLHMRNVHLGTSMIEEELVANNED